MHFKANLFNIDVFSYAYILPLFCSKKFIYVRNFAIKIQMSECTYPGQTCCRNLKISLLEQVISALEAKQSFFRIGQGNSKLKNNSNIRKTNFFNIFFLTISLQADFLGQHFFYRRCLACGVFVKHPSIISKIFSQQAFYRT